jgi:hypothetical protein
LQNGRANDGAVAVVFPFQVVDRVDLRHAGDQNAAGVDAEVIEVGDVDVVAVGVDALAQPGA